MASKRRDACPPVDAERLALDMRSPDGAVRGEAVRSLCPCHAGWEVFEGHVGEVLRALRDDDRSVRAHALHVFEDAARMAHVGEAEYYLREVEEAARRKRASRFRPGEGGSGDRLKDELGRIRNRLKRHKGPR
jgi:hypothetical protein